MSKIDQQIKKIIAKKTIFVPDNVKTNPLEFKFNELRELADKNLKGRLRRKHDVSQDAIEVLVKEVATYKKELESQNEKLKIAQARLEDSRDKYYKLYDFAPVAYLTFDSKGIITEINLAGAKQLGIEREKIISTALDSYIDDKHKKIFQTHLKETTKSKEKHECELKLKKANGKAACVLLESTAFEDSKDKNIQIKSIIIDISEQKAIEEEKNNFIAIMSHELRNPLTPILSGAQLILAQYKKNHKNFLVSKEFKEAITTIEQQAKNLARLLDDLLDIARIGSGHIILKKQTLNLNESINHAIRAIQPLIKDQNHNLTVSLPKTPVFIEADPVRIEQIIVNLLNNAIKYTSPHGQIDLELKRLNQHAEIYVRDNGIGIDSTRFNTIFNLFSRGVAPFISTRGEFGIGLNLSRNLIAMHNGTITAFSKGKDQGSEFVIKLPALPENIKLNLPLNGESNPKEAKYKILITDDNESILKLLGRMIKFFGHDIRLTRDGATALQTAKEYKPDIVLIDIGMPGMSGYEVAREMRKLEKSLDYKMKIIAITGYGQEADKDKALLAGFDLHLTKPVRMDILEKAINTIF